jgi:hypothetical protein
MSRAAFGAVGAKPDLRGLERLRAARAVTLPKKET